MIYYAPVRHEGFPVDETEPDKAGMILEKRIVGN